MSGFAPLQDTTTGRSSSWNATGEAAHVVLDSGTGATAGVSLYGYLRTTNEPNFWFTEPFDSLDTTNRWTTKLSTGTAAVTNGVLNISSSTTASAYGGLYTQPTFAPNGLNFVAFGLTQSIPNVVQANTLRFWGWGSVQTTPTTTAPIINGAGFELSATGVLTAVVYQNGVKSSNVSTGVTLTNNVPFYSAMARRADRIDFFVNSTQTPVATILIPTLYIATLPWQAIAINAASAPAAAAQMNILAFGIGDTGQNANALADPTNPWIRAAVKKASTAAAATDPALVVSMAGANSATKVGDGTNNAAIKAASTAAVAADPSLVVALHPSSPLNGQGASGAAIAGNPVRVAGRGVSANYAVTTGQAADLAATLQGILVTRPWNIPESDWSYAAAAGGILNTTTAVTIKAAAAAGIRNYLTSITLMAEALGAATEVAIRDGAAGTVLWRTKIPTGGLPTTTITFANPLKGTAATLMEVVTLTASVTGAVYVNAQGYIAP